jgi:acetyl esterase
VAAQALLYPALDHRRDSASYREFATGFGLTAADMAWFWNHYVDARLGDHPRVSPLRDGDLAGRPPTFVATAGADVLRDEGERYAEGLRSAGGSVTAKRYDGMIHGFWWMDAVLDGARTLQRDLADFLAGARRDVTWWAELARDRRLPPARWGVDVRRPVCPGVP